MILSYAWNSYTTFWDALIPMYHFYQEELPRRRRSFKTFLLITSVQLASLSCLVCIAHNSIYLLTFNSFAVAGGSGYILSRATMMSLLEEDENNIQHIDKCIAKVWSAQFRKCCRPVLKCWLVVHVQTQGGEWCWWPSDWAVSQCVADAGTIVARNYTGAQQVSGTVRRPQDYDWNFLFEQNCPDGDIRPTVKYLVNVSDYSTYLVVWLSAL